MLDGRIIEDREVKNWAQVGGLIGNFVGAVDVIQVRQNGSIVLLYNADGIL